MSFDFADDLSGGVLLGHCFQQGVVLGVDEQDEAGFVVGLEVVFYVEGCGEQAGLGCQR